MDIDTDVKYTSNVSGEINDSQEQMLDSTSVQLFENITPEIANKRGRVNRTPVDDLLEDVVSNSSR